MLMTEDTPSSQGSAMATPTGRSAEDQPCVALIGRAGAGKTALARALFGAESKPETSGAIARYQGATTAFIVDDLPGWVNGSESSLSALFSYMEAAPAAHAPIAAIR